MRTIVTLAVSNILIAGCASAQEVGDGPPPLVHWTPPSAATIESRYVCGRDVVEVSIEDGEQGVRVVRYEDAAGAASEEELARWNAWLEPIGRFGSHQFSCRGGVSTLVAIRGTDARGSDAIVVPVQWSNGRLYRTPVVQGTNWD